MKVSSIIDTMLLRSRWLISFILLFINIPLSAKVVSETLQSSDNDKVTIRYEVVSRDGNLVVKIEGINIQLGYEHARKYQDSDKLKVLFFDKNGGYKDHKFESDMGTEPLLVNTDEIDYYWSDGGYVWLEKDSEFQMRLLVSKATLSIPVYLVYSEKPFLFKEKANTLKVFAKCGMWELRLSDDNITIETANHSNSAKEENDAKSAEEADTKMAMTLVAKIRDLLNTSSRTNLPEGLDDYTSQLRQLELAVTDKYVKSSISEVLQNVENKKAEIERLKSEVQKQVEKDAARKRTEEEADHNIKYVSDRLDNIENLTENDVSELKSYANDLRRQSYGVENPELSEQMKKTADRCDEAIKKIEDSKKRRTIWTVIGGILLAILMFVGNQIFVHFRNLRSQKGIEEMQAKIVRQAENQAKRRARSMVRSKISQAENKIIRKSQDTVKSGLNNGIDTLSKGKGKKRVSI